MRKIDWKVKNTRSQSQRLCKLSAFVCSTSLLIDSSSVQHLSNRPISNASFPCQMTQVLSKCHHKCPKLPNFCNSKDPKWKAQSQSVLLYKTIKLSQKPIMCRIIQCNYAGDRQMFARDWQLRLSFGRETAGCDKGLIQQRPLQLDQLPMQLTPHRICPLNKAIPLQDASLLNPFTHLTVSHLSKFASSI